MPYIGFKFIQKWRLLETQVKNLEIFLRLDALGQGRKRASVEQL